MCVVWYSMCESKMCSLNFLSTFICCPAADPSFLVVETNWLVFLLRPLIGCPPNDLIFHSFSGSSLCAINHCDVIFLTAVPTAGELKCFFSERVLRSDQLTSGFTSQSRNDCVDLSYSSDVHTLSLFLKFPFIPPGVFKVMDCFCSVYPGKTHFENLKISQCLCLVFVFGPEYSIWFSESICVCVERDPSWRLCACALMARGRNVSKSTERFFYETLLWKNVWLFCHLLLPDSLLLRSCKKQDICTLGCLVLCILRVMGFWEIAKQKHFMNIL